MPSSFKVIEKKLGGGRFAIPINQNRDNNSTT